MSELVAESVGTLQSNVDDLVTRLGRAAAIKAQIVSLEAELAEEKEAAIALHDGQGKQLEMAGAIFTFKKSKVKPRKDHPEIHLAIQEIDELRTAVDTLKAKDIDPLFAAIAATKAQLKAQEAQLEAHYQAIPEVVGAEEHLASLEASLTVERKTLSIQLRSIEPRQI